MSDELPLRSLGIEERALEDALLLGPALLGAARRDRGAWIAASLVAGPGVVLGAAQRAGRVVDLEACGQASARVLRRATTGTAAFVGERSIVWTLALPDVAALAPDASPRTLLNRNVRGFLRGLRTAGAAAHYFGREWISVKHRPAALLGFDVSRSGEVLVEVLAGFDEPIAIPEALAAPEERAVDRWQGKSPAALAELFPSSRMAGDIARIVVESMGAQAVKGAIEAAADPALVCPAITDGRDPVPFGLTIAPPRRVPIGFLEAAASPAVAGMPRRAWLGGDALAPTWALAEIARAIAAGEPLRIQPGEIAIEGALFEDLESAAKSALGNG